jgi:hypothetical protein
MLAVGVASGIGVWMFYVGVEPYVRRIWPESIISWTRLIQGSVTDPLVGQSLLVGATLGAWALVIIFVNRKVPGLLGMPPAPPWVDARLGVGVLDGSRQAVSHLIHCGLMGVQTAMILLVEAVLLKLLVRRTWVALLILGAAQTMLWLVASPVLTEWSWGVFALALPLVSLLIAITLFAMVRYGVLAVMAGAAVFTALGSMPITFRADTWYAGAVLLGMLFVLAVPLYGAGTAVAGRTKLA